MTEETSTKTGEVSPTTEGGGFTKTSHREELLLQIGELPEVNERRPSQVERSNHAKIREEHLVSKEQNHLQSPPSQPKRRGNTATLEEL